MVARVGADEFAVVLLDLGEDRMAAVEHVEAVANRIFEAVALQFGQSGLQHYITASIGAVLFDGDEPPVEQVIQQADVAVYQAKCAGRNSLAFFDPRVQNKLMQRHRLEQELREAIRGNQLVPYYQGQYDAGGKLVGVELLIRWQHPERGLLTPGDFIPVAEASGLIVELGERVVRLAVDQLVRWAAHEHTAELPVSVNISACHFEQPGFVERLATIVENRSLRPFALKLEITESVLAHDLAGVSQRIAALHDIGIGLSLDDFGTGYSSLAYLKRLPIHQVKIDQTFVRDLLVDDNDLGITETIITLADTLGMDVVAEGVEEEAQRDVLERLGCRVFQGFLFGRPAPIAQFESDHDLNPDTIDHWS
jgi:EAL domain-containing protein (putative c-di-GMP-specific phosphodiesterase class I)